MTEHPIVVFTDGAAKRNPGPGGWGVVIVTPDGHVTELGGGAPLTTNNKMELSGAIAALAHLERPTAAWPSTPTPPTSSRASRSGCTTGGGEAGGPPAMARC